MHDVQDTEKGKWYDTDLTLNRPIGAWQGMQTNECNYSYVPIRILAEVGETDARWLTIGFTTSEYKSCAKTGIMARNHRMHSA